MTNQVEHLALYYYPSCFFCQRVLSALQQLQLEVELRDVLKEPSFREELIKARGRSTVPVLRITTLERDRWLPESSDIIDYLTELDAQRA